MTKTSEHLFSKKLVVVGGLPSSASTLLASLLNNHPKVLCGGECNLFAHPAIINGTHTPRTVNNSAVCLKDGVFWPSVTVNNSMDYYRVEQKCFLNITDSIHKTYQHRSVPQRLFHCLYRSHSDAESASVFMEKSPPNIYGMHAALQAEQNLQVIVTIRDPYTTALSLIRRGFEKQTAYAEVRLATEIAYLLKSGPNSDRILVVKAENMSATPHEELKRILNFLGLDGFPARLIEARRPNIKLDGWSQSVADPPKKLSVAAAKFSHLALFAGMHFKNLDAFVGQKGDIFVFAKALNAFGYMNAKYRLLVAYDAFINLLSKQKKIKASGRMASLHSQVMRGSLE